MPQNKFLRLFISGYITKTKLQGVPSKVKFINRMAYNELRASRWKPSDTKPLTKTYPTVMVEFDAITHHP